MIDIRVPDPKKKLENAYARAKQKGILRLGNLQLTRFPDEIHRFNEYTLPGDNWWEDVPLSHIDLSNNPISEIDPRISNLRELVIFKMINAQITEIPPEIFFTENLKSLDLAGNKIEVLPSEVGKCESLAELNLSRNQLTDVPRSIGNLLRLDNLLLSENQLESIPSEVKKIKFYLNKKLIFYRLEI